MNRMLQNWNLKKLALVRPLDSTSAEITKMQIRRTVLERAFELARSGRCRSMAEVRTALRAEGYTDHELTGKGLSDQLRALIKLAKPIGHRGC